MDVNFLNVIFWILETFKNKKIFELFLFFQDWPQYDFMIAFPSSRNRISYPVDHKNQFINSSLMTKAWKAWKNYSDEDCQDQIRDSIMICLKGIIGASWQNLDLQNSSGLYISVICAQPVFVLIQTSGISIYFQNQSITNHPAKDTKFGTRRWLCWA